MTLHELRHQLTDEGSLRLLVKAIPKAARCEILIADDVVKVKVTAAAEKGKANAAICELLATEFGVPNGNVRVLRGATAARKLVEILL